MVVSEEYFHS